MVTLLLERAPDQGIALCVFGGSIGYRLVQRRRACSYALDAVVDALVEALEGISHLRLFWSAT